MSCVACVVLCVTCVLLCVTALQWRVSGRSMSGWAECWAALSLKPSITSWKLWRVQRYGRSDLVTPLRQIQHCFLKLPCVCFSLRVEVRSCSVCRKFSVVWVERRPPVTETSTRTPARCSPTDPWPSAAPSQRWAEDSSLMSFNLNDTSTEK